MAIVRSGQPEPQRMPRILQGLDLQERWYSGRPGRAGGPFAAPPPPAELGCGPRARLCTTIPRALASSAINGLSPGRHADIVSIALSPTLGPVHEARHR